jgi:NADH dehydrogenase [ubiquinone] 1 alpha subcomplex assembly factor 5
MSMHWVNDLPGMLAQIRATLEPNGVFLGAMLGGETLHEMRVSLQLAEEAILGGVGAHVSPMIESRDAANLLSQTGFTMTTVDVDTILVPYPDMMTLMRHLQGMAEGNALRRRHPWLSRQVLKRATEIYRERFPVPKEKIKEALASDGEVFVDNEQNWIGSTFQVIYMVGWVPA